METRQCSAEKGKTAAGGNDRRKRVLISCAMTLLLAWLFYSSPLALLLVIPIYLGLGPYLRKRREQRR